MGEKGPLLIEAREELNKACKLGRTGASGGLDACGARLVVAGCLSRRYVVLEPIWPLLTAVALVIIASRLVY